MADIPHDISTLATAVRDRCRSDPDHVALWTGSQALSYGDLNRLADGVAASLRRDGIGAGDVVAISAQNSQAYVVLMIGAARANVVLAPLPNSADAAARKAMLVDSGAVLIFVDHPDDAISSASTVRCVCLDEDKWSRWLEVDVPSEPQAPVAADEPTTIIYSSGTTGTPKGIVQPHRYRSTMLRNSLRRGYSGDAVTLLATPLYSNTTLSGLVQTLGAGGTIILMSRFDAAQWLRLAETLRATHAMLVPIMYQRLLAHPDFDGTDLSAFRMKYCTSAPFAIGLKQEVLSRWPGGLTEIYGMTEGGATFVLTAHEHPDKLHTVGRAAPGSEVRILDDDDQDVAPGRAGEIVGRSPGMMVGYHNRPGETAASRWVAPDGSAWQRTGDVGRLDEDGFLILVDRKKDMIISGGFNIYPSDIEAVLTSHPDVRDNSVVGVPSVTWGETPVAFVVAPGGDAEALREWVNAKVGKMQRVSDVVLVEDLPRNAIGKVLKRDLRDRYVAIGSDTAGPC